MMDIRIEPNQRFGYGFQLRVMDGPVCEIYDDEPLTYIDAMELMYDAGEYLGGTPKQLAIRPADSPNTTSGPDVFVFKPGPNGWEQTEGGELPAASVQYGVIAAWELWKKYSADEGKSAMRRYCEYISAHGYRGGVSRAMAELEAMNFNRGAKWIKRTFAKYVRDQTAAIRYVLPQT